MKNLILTPAALALIQAETSTGRSFGKAAVEREDGLFQYPVSDETYDRLIRLGFDGESHSDIVERVIAMVRGGFN